MTKIPEFPKFKDLELADRGAVERLTKKFKPYSDFNFSSLWAWSIKNKAQIAKLNKNLVVVFNDYISNQPTISFIGNNQLDETALALFKFSQARQYDSKLRLIAEETADLLDKKFFQVTPDPDAFDYIYPIANLANMNNWPKSRSRKNIRQFSQNYPDYQVKISSIHKVNKEEHLKMFQTWAENKDIPNYFELNEYKAFKRFLDLENHAIKVVSLYVNQVLVGFTVYEIQTNDYVLSHFAKANTKFHRGANDMLNWEEAKILDAKGFKYYNWEQDLGLLGLRKSKEKYKPSFFLKKYIVEKK